MLNGNKTGEACNFASKAGQCQLLNLFWEGDIMHFQWRFQSCQVTWAGNTCSEAAVTAEFLCKARSTIHQAMHAWACPGLEPPMCISLLTCGTFDLCWQTCKYLSSCMYCACIHAALDLAFSSLYRDEVHLVETEICSVISAASMLQLVSGRTPPHSHQVHVGTEPSQLSHFAHYSSDLPVCDVKIFWLITEHYTRVYIGGHGTHAPVL